MEAYDHTTNSHRKALHVCESPLLSGVCPVHPCLTCVCLNLRGCDGGVAAGVVGITLGLTLASPGLGLGLGSVRVPGRWGTGQGRGGRLTGSGEVWVRKPRPPGASTALARPPALLRTLPLPEIAVPVPASPDKGCQEPLRLAYLRRKLRRAKAVCTWASFVNVNVSGLGHW